MFCKHLRQFFHAQKPNGDSQTAEETNGVLLIRFVDVLQYPFVGLVKGVRQIRDCQCRVRLVGYSVTASLADNTFIETYITT